MHPHNSSTGIDVEGSLFSPYINRGLNKHRHPFVVCLFDPGHQCLLGRKAGEVRGAVAIDI